MKANKKPKTLRDFEKAFPEIWKAYGQLRDTCDRGPLQPKTRELVKIGIETALERHGGIAAHVRRAVKAGARKNEIYHAMMLAAPLAGFPAVLDAFLIAKKHLS